MLPCQLVPGLVNHRWWLQAAAEQQEERDQELASMKMQIMDHKVAAQHILESALSNAAHEAQHAAEQLEMQEQQLEELRSQVGAQVLQSNCL